MFDSSWGCIATSGYHPKSAIYYDGPEVTSARGTPELNSVLSGFCWKQPIDMVNFIGMLLTGLTIGHWPGKHPIAVFNADRAGAGKTLLANLLGIILDGASFSITYTSNDEEFEKQLATGVEAGGRDIVIDNVKSGRRYWEREREISSPVLERSVTADILNFRRLGFNAAIRRPNDVIFCLTINNALLCT